MTNEEIVEIVDKRLVKLKLHEELDLRSYVIEFTIKYSYKYEHLENQNRCLSILANCLIARYIGKKRKNKTEI